MDVSAAVVAARIPRLCFGKVCRVLRSYTAVFSVLKHRFPPFPSLFRPKYVFVDNVKQGPVLSSPRGSPRPGTACLMVLSPPPLAVRVGSHPYTLAFSRISSRRNWLAWAPEAWGLRSGCQPVKEERGALTSTGVFVLPPTPLGPRLALPTRSPPHPPQTQSSCPPASCGGPRLLRGHPCLSSTWCISQSFSPVFFLKIDLF